MDFKENDFIRDIYETRKSIYKDRMEYYKKIKILVGHETFDHICFSIRFRREFIGNETVFYYMWIPIIIDESIEGYKIEIVDKEKGEIKWI